MTDEKAEQTEFAQLEAQSFEGVNDTEVRAIDDDPVNKKLFHKINLRLITVLGVIYAISVIDRINIGSARVIGMDQDLGTAIGSRYSICLLIYFPASMVCELFGNMALVKFGVANSLTVMTIGVGIFTIAQGHVQSWQVLAVMRAFLGCFEASIFPAQLLILSSWYPRYKVHKILAAMYAIGQLASAFAGLLAYGIGTGMYGLRGLSGWRWIFTIEGVASSLVGLLAWFFISDFPDRANFLSEEERSVVMRRLELDRANVVTEQISKKNLEDLKDGIIWLSTLLYTFNVVAVYGLAFFVPTILKNLGYSGVHASLYSAWPYFVSIGFLGISSYLGDRYHRRLPIIIVQACCSITGFALVSSFTLSSNVRYFGVFLAVAGAQSNNAAILIFGQNNIVGQSKMSINAIMMVAGAAVAGVIGSTIFIADQAPQYVPGFGTAMALQAMVVAAAGGAWIVLGRENRKADRNGTEIQKGVSHWRYTL